MKIIGLTGGVASGKSTISKFLQSKNLPVIDLDIIVHELYKQPEVVAKIKQTFATANRDALRALVFTDEKKRQQLENILHPLAIEAARRELQNYQNQNKPCVFLVAPLLIEAKMHKLCDEVWVISIDKNKQLERLMWRPNIHSKQEAQNIIDSQMSGDERLKYATKIIDNNGSKTELLKAAAELLEKVEKLISIEV